MSNLHSDHFRDQSVPGAAKAGNGGPGQHGRRPKHTISWHKMITQALAQSTSILILLVKQWISCPYDGMLQLTALGGAPLYRSPNSISHPPAPHTSTTFLPLSGKFMPPKKNPKNVCWTLKLTTCSSPPPPGFSLSLRDACRNLLWIPLLCYLGSGRCES